MCSLKGARIDNAVKMYLKHGSIIGLMMNLWVETCRRIYNWQ